MATGFFQKRIEEIISNVTNLDNATALTADQIALLSSQLALYFSTCLLSLIGIFLAGLFIFWFLKRRGKPASTADKMVTQLHLLQEIETRILTLTSQPAVWLTNRSTFDAKVVYEFNIALSPEVHWHAPRTISTSWHMGDRLVVFTDQHDLLTTSLLDEMLCWFRRVDRALMSELINVDDLYGLWRYILPFATDNRFSFMASYLNAGNEDSTEEIAPVNHVLVRLLQYCHQQKFSQPLNYLNGRLDPLFFEGLPNNLKKRLNAADTNRQNRTDPAIPDKPETDTARKSAHRKEPVIGTDVPLKNIKTTARKEPIVSFENVDVDRQKE